MKLNDIFSDLFSDSLPPLLAPLCRQPVARTQPVIVPSIENLIALKQKFSIYRWGVADVHSQAVVEAVLKGKEVLGPC